MSVFHSFLFDSYTAWLDVIACELSSDHTFSFICRAHFSSIWLLALTLLFLGLCVGYCAYVIECEFPGQEPGDRFWRIRTSPGSVPPTFSAISVSHQADSDYLDNRTVTVSVYIHLIWG